MVDIRDDCNIWLFDWALFRWHVRNTTGFASSMWQLLIERNGIHNCDYWYISASWIPSGHASDVHAVMSLWKPSSSSETRCLRLRDLMSNSWLRSLFVQWIFCAKAHTSFSIDHAETKSRSSWRLRYQWYHHCVCIVTSFPQNIWLNISRFMGPTGTGKSTVSVSFLNADKRGCVTLDSSSILHRTKRDKLLVIL